MGRRDARLDSARRKEAVKAYRASRTQKEGMDISSAEKHRVPIAKVDRSKVKICQGYKL